MDRQDRHRRRSRHLGLEQHNDELPCPSVNDFARRAKVVIMRHDGTAKRIPVNNNKIVGDIVVVP
jgi:hypothetical protein